MNLKTSIGLLLCATAAGCAAPMDDMGDDAEFRAATKKGTWNDRTGTYKNSPRVDKHAVSDFLEDPSLGAGMALVAIENASGQRDQVVFDGDELVAYTSAGELRGASLVGWSLIFQSDAGSEVGVYIGSYSDQPDWVNGHLIPTYGLANVEIGSSGDPEYSSVCPDLDWQDGTNVVFIRGETYDHNAIEVQANTLGRVTIACQGHSIAKLKFMGADPNDSYKSSSKDRQAALKMLTADYCGDGHSYTTYGQSLDWVDSLGRFTLNYGPSFDDLEARFDETGATCLNTPRNTTLSRDAVDCADELPKCFGDPRLLHGSLWATYP